MTGLRLVRIVLGALLIVAGIFLGWSYLVEYAGKGDLPNAKFSEFCALVSGACTAVCGGLVIRSATKHG